MLATVVIYELITVAGYRALIDVGKPAASEGLSVPFQQTARYVCEYEDEVTEYERQVINDTLNFDAMKNYEPRISDPIKILYRGGDLGPYMKIWVQMFSSIRDAMWRHLSTRAMAIWHRWNRT